MCESFVEQMTGCGWQGVSAIDAWQRNKRRQRVDRAFEVGDAIYFDAHSENGYYGHTGIVTGEDAFTSVTVYGVKTYPISAWVAPYLGWIRY